MHISTLQIACQLTRSRKHAQYVQDPGGKIIGTTECNDDLLLILEHRGMSVELKGNATAVHFEGLAAKLIGPLPHDDALSMATRLYSSPGQISLLCKLLTKLQSGRIMRHNFLGLHAIPIVEIAFLSIALRLASAVTTHCLITPATSLALIALIVSPRVQTRRDLASWMAWRYLSL
jgi:hypothetical protein